MPIHDTENITCVEPADYPASRVSWSSDNAQVRFIGGERIWYVGPAPVGFFENEDRLAVPIHQ